MIWVLYVTAFVAGAFVGSFLNVVVHRGPGMWGLDPNAADSKSAGDEDFAAPPSYCPACGARLVWRDLVPIASYLALRGKCRTCAAPIPLRYPLVEIAGGVAAVASLAAFGATFAALFAAIFLFFLIALAAFDAETGYLPDALTLPLVWLGLLANLDGRFTPLEEAVIGAAAGYLVFRLVAEGYRALRGREGLGGGDAKLLAAIGAWTGYLLLPAVVLVAALAGLLYAATGAARGRKIGAMTALRFGPWLCVAGAAAFLSRAFLGPI